MSHRLLVDNAHWQRLRSLPEHPLLQKTGRVLAELADSWVGDEHIPVDETVHNWTLLRARQAQIRILGLLVQYGISGDRQYRSAAMNYLRALAGWQHWSWHGWREQLPDSDERVIYDLSFGENAATLALAYDWLDDELSAEDRELLLYTANERVFQPYLRANDTPGTPPAWYFNSPHSNWNTVCNGGAGLLALSLGATSPYSTRVLELVEEGIKPYFTGMQQDGAWPEGIGYWGYGHRYGYLYLLSHERVSGKTHPLLMREGSRNTLRFPLLFSPHGVAAGFGDVNTFFPLPFMYAAAERFGMTEVISELDRRFLAMANDDPMSLHTTCPWAACAELLLMHPGISSTAACQWPLVNIQRGIEWSFLADSWPQPSLYASLRGGTTAAPHTHQDLTSMHVIVNGERLIENISVDEYFDSTFSAQRFEIYENSAASKNILLINGVGLPQDAAVTSRIIGGTGWEGVQLYITAALGPGCAAQVCGRSVLMLEGAALLILDRMLLQQAGLAEARFHSYFRVRHQRAQALITGKHETLHMAFAANVHAQCNGGRGLPTSPGKPSEHILRWQTTALHRDIVLATLLTPNDEGQLKLDPTRLLLHISNPEYGITLRYSEDSLDIARI